MRRLAIVAAGLLLGLTAAVAVLGLGLVGWAAGLDAPAASGLLAIVASLAQHGSTTLLVRGLFGLWVAALSLGFLPVAVAALVGEAARLAEPVWYAGGSGALAAAVPFVWRAVRDAPARDGEGRTVLLLFLSGVASGFVYWLVAGRGAGTR